MRSKIIFIIAFITCGILLLLKAEAEEVDTTQVNDKYAKILVTSKVVEALGMIGGPEASDLLIQALKSEEFFIRANAAQALGRIREKESIPLLKKLINDENYLARIFALVALIDLGQEDEKETLAALLEDEDPAVRATAVGQVAQMDARFPPVLNEMLLKEKDDSVRIALISQLGSIKFKLALLYIRKALEDENSDVRVAACEAVANFGDKESLPQLSARLSDENVSVRAAAISALSRLGDSSLIEDLQKAIEDETFVEDEDPVFVAARYVALANSGKIEILPALLKEVVGSESSFIRRKAARALVLLKPYLLKVVRRSLKESDNISLLNNLQFSYKIEGVSPVVIFTQALKDKDDPLYEDAPIILMSLGGKLALPALRNALLEDDPELVATSAYVLGMMQDKDAISYLLRVFKKYGI